MLKQCPVSRHCNKGLPHFFRSRKHISTPFPDKKASCQRIRRISAGTQAFIKFFNFPVPLFRILCKKIPPFCFLRLYDTLKGAKYRHKSPKRYLCILLYDRKSRPRFRPLPGNDQLFWVAKQAENSLSSVIYFQRLSLRKCSAQSLCQSLSIIR